MKGSWLRKRGIWLVVVVLVALIGVLLVGCHNGGTKPPPARPFKIALVTWPGYVPLFVAQEKGFFDGLNVEFKVIDDTAPRHAAFKSGDVDMIAETVDSFASGAPTYGMGVKAVYKVDDSKGADGLVVTKNITNIGQLRGKKVALPRGMPSHFLMLNLLRMNNMTSKDIQVLDMAPQAAGQAFSAGKVEAAVTWEPYVSEAAQKGNGTVLLDSKQVYGWIVDIMVVSDKTVQERAADIQKVVNAHFRGLEYMQQHPEESYQIGAKHLPPLTPKDVGDMLTLIDRSDVNDNKRFFSQENKFGFATVFTKASEAWKDEGLISNAVDPAQAFTTQFVDAYTGPSVATHQGPEKTTRPANLPTEAGVSSLAVPLHFDTGDWHLQKEHYEKLRPVGEALLGFPAFYMRIEGHTDSVGGRAMNVELSQKRAQSVAEYLQGSFGISADRTFVKGYGPDNPIASNANEEGRAQNRRVQFVLVKGNEAPAAPAGGGKSQ